MDGPGDHGVDLARHGEPGRFLQRRNGGARGLWRGLAGRGPLKIADEPVVEARVELTALKGGAEDFRADSGGIARRNADGA